MNQWHLLCQGTKGKVLELNVYIDFEYFLGKLGTGKEIWTRNIYL